MNKKELAKQGIILHRDDIIWMNEEENEHIYALYKVAKRLIERTEACCEEDHSHESMFQEWKEAIRIFDGLGRGYAERYEKEKNND